MRIYKELSFCGNKEAIDLFKKIAPSLSKGDWKFATNEPLKEYISFDYTGSKVDQAEVSIYCGEESWRDWCIKVVNIVPLMKDQLSIQEYNSVLDLFFEEVIAPNKEKFIGLTVFGPESDVFDPLKYISEDALKKLELFCNLANKTTGSSHPSDEERWFDFICQTVDDNQTFDYDTLYRFLMDEEYWGRKEPNFIGAMGRFAWSEELASELASEYENYVRLLEYYKDKIWQKEYEAAQQ